MCIQTFNTQQGCQRDAIILFTIILCFTLCVIIICTIITSYILSSLFSVCECVCVHALVFIHCRWKHAGTYWTTIVLCATKTTLSLTHTNTDKQKNTHIHTHTLPGWLTYRHFTLLTSTNWIRVHSLCTSTHSHTDTTCTSTHMHKHTRTSTLDTQQAQNGWNTVVRVGLSVASKVTEQRAKERWDKEGVSLLLFLYAKLWLHFGSLILRLLLFFSLQDFYCLHLKKKEKKNLYLCTYIYIILCRTDSYWWS